MTSRLDGVWIFLVEREDKLLLIGWPFCVLPLQTFLVESRRELWIEQTETVKECMNHADLDLRAPAWLLETLLHLGSWRHRLHLHSLLEANVIPFPWKRASSSLSLSLSLSHSTKPWYYSQLNRADGKLWFAEFLRERNRNAVLYICHLRMARPRPFIFYSLLLRYRPQRMLRFTSTKFVSVIFVCLAN